MKKLLPLFFLFTLQACSVDAQPDTLSREMIIGTWTEYRIDSTEKYLTIPDSLKNDSTVRYPVSFFISNIYEFNADGTYGFFVGLPGVEMGWEGTWNVRNDTIFLHREDKMEMYLVPRLISPKKLEIGSAGEVLDGEAVKTYWFLWKWD